MSALPQGHETELGDRTGTRLSRGQGMRVAVARALARAPGLLVFDEATSALEPALEAQVLQGARSLLPDAAIVIVTQRPSAAELADRVVVLEDGRVIAEGTHADLCDTSKHYRQILRENRKTIGSKP